MAKHCVTVSDNNKITFTDLMANIFWTKHGIDNRTMAFESTSGPLRRLRIAWTLVHKRLKMGSSFLPTLCTHTQVIKRNPTKLYQTVGGKWRWCQPNKVSLHSECKLNSDGQIPIWDLNSILGVFGSDTAVSV